MSMVGSFARDCLSSLTVRIAVCALPLSDDTVRVSVSVSSLTSAVISSSSRKNMLPSFASPKENGPR